MKVTWASNVPDLISAIARLAFSALRQKRWSCAGLCCASTVQVGLPNPACVEFHRSVTESKR